MKKAFHPCIWVALLSLIIFGIIFLVRVAYPTASKPDATVSVASSEASIPKININTADSAALQQLPGIGPSIADSIISYREANGPFTDPTQLLNIPGIGKKRLITLLEYVNWEE